MIRVLVVDDSLTARKWVTEMVQNDSEMVVVGEAVDGQLAIEMTERLNPDVIVMDMAMPRASGVDATRQIMAYRPKPIVILSGAENRGANVEVIDAMRAGALDAVEKPGADDDMEHWKQHFLTKLRVASGVKVIRHISGKIAPTRTRLSPGKEAKLVMIGASTGGPKTVANILSSLPPLPVPILIVIHFPGGLFEHFVDWLASVSSMPVLVPREGARLDSLAGMVCAAAPGRHLVVCGDRIRTTVEAPRHSCTPSVDALFESAAISFGNRALAVLLTGMGRDGAQGMLRIHQAGGRTIAQDEATSAVFGMPKAAIDLHAADQILPEHEIAGTIVGMCQPAGCGVP